ncbi:FMN-dependent NADH-azoreductase [Paenibacillus sp. D2_2]|uniref:FMN-dependent NADH-azoreductase n=1 Tax=Paenibacillus sp. D2_2 TaxID=3073092 RepID=UPI002815B55E|nr:FMN-dependent NADH-azoreductase [Paenibacillus sp. D2_2]WMT40803.1 FMN-dependent NADH-azoreductase [Paenibacillus sp. D2_2]
MNILVVKANNRPEGISNKMYETFMERIKDADHLNIKVFDVFEEDMPYFGQDFFSAAHKKQNHFELSDIEQRILAAKQKAMDALKEADVIVFAFPLWNFTIPAKLQTFVDYVAEAGFSFKYSPEGKLIQLMTDKKVILLNARGGIYSSPERAPIEMAVTYIKNTFNGMFGMEIIDEVIIEGHNAMRDKREEIIEEGLKKVSKAANILVEQTKIIV